MTKRNGWYEEKEGGERERGRLMKVSSYVLALRPWSLSGSLVPSLLGAALAFKYTPFSYLLFFLTLLTVISVHCAGNLVNTYFDYVKGQTISILTKCVLVMRLDGTGSNKI
jgi:heme O synthase-like polyprenyltransferase